MEYILTEQYNLTEIISDQFLKSFYATDCPKIKFYFTFFSMKQLNSENS